MQKKKPKSNKKAKDNTIKSDMGRPTKFTNETIEKLEYAFSIGCSDLEACLYANISPASLYNWQKDNQEFLDRKNMLKESPVLMARKNVADALNKGDVEMSTWYLEKKKSDEFNTKVKNEVTGADGGGLNLVVKIVDNDRAGND